MLTPFIIAALLGFKHALDPDHLAATINMTISGKLNPLSAAKLGLSWGLGHATTMFLLGLPIVLFSAQFPDWVYSSAELGVGVVIVYLAVQLFLQWFAGEFHPHNLRDLEHSTEEHERAHKRAGLMGMLHGVGGSAGAGLLMVSTFSNPISASIALILFVSLSIASMSLVTCGFSLVATHHFLMHAMDRLLIPVFIVVTGVFGFHYIQEAARGLGLW